MNEINNTAIALIAGATGLTGSVLLNLLLEDNRYTKVIALSRKPGEIQHPKLEWILTDGKDLLSHSEQLTCDHIFCCLGTTIRKAGSQAAFEAIDLTYPVELGKICKANGASHYLLVTAIGADKDSSIFYNRIKGRCEAAVCQLNFPLTTIFRPSILDGDRKEFRLGEKLGLILGKLLAPFMLGKFKKYRPTSVERLAQDMISQAWRSGEKLIILEG